MHVIFHENSKLKRAFTKRSQFKRLQKKSTKEKNYAKESQSILVFNTAVYCNDDNHLRFGKT